MIAVDEGAATAEKPFAVGPRQIALYGAGVEEVALAVRLVEMYQCSVPVKEVMATEGVER